jgi:hypothetical protein
MLPSVSVIYIKIYHKLIPVFFINKRRERMHWEESGKISKLKKKQFSTRVITSTTHHDSNNFLLQPV